MTAAELKKHVEVSGWAMVAADLTAGIELRERFREENDKLRELLGKADEALKHHGGMQYTKYVARKGHRSAVFAQDLIERKQL